MHNMDKQKYFYNIDYILGWDKTSSLWCNIKWSIQRIIYGYDERMFWNLDLHLKTLMITGLRYYVKHNYCKYLKPKSKSKSKTNSEAKTTNKNDSWYTENETRNILRKMIKYILFSCPDIVEQYLNGQQWNENEHPEIDIQEIHDYTRKYHNKAFDLLKIHFNDLWY